MEKNMFKLLKKKKKDITVEQVPNDLNTIAQTHVQKIPDDIEQTSKIEEEKIEANINAIKFLEREMSETTFKNELAVFEFEINRINKENEKLGFKTEQRKLEKKYPKIDLSFLSKKQENKDEETRMTSFSSSDKKNINQVPYVPIFSFHRLEKNRDEFSFNECVIDLRCLKNVSNKHDLDRISLQDGSFEILRNIAKVFTDRLIKEEECRRLSGSSFQWSTTVSSRNGRQWFVDDIRFRHDFKGLMPKVTKEKITDAMGDFLCPETGRHNIFLIKECQDWTAEVITRDPLVVGILGDQAYLIDHFDCTDMEAYVRKEFTN